MRLGKNIKILFHSKFFSKLNFINYDKFEKYLDFGGIRIEDNILITDNKSENLSDFIIKEVDDIESIMN